MSKNTHPARGPRALARVAVIIGAAAIGCGSAAAATEVNLLETGSTLLYPLFNLWVPAYTQKHDEVRITTQGTGSGTGISEAVSKVAQIGASDAYMSNAQMKHDPGILNIPLAISSQMISYNVPGLNDKHLKLSGPVLSGIFQGKIASWDDPAIAKINPGVKLPHQTIVPIHRTDGSGDTFIFTQYLTASASDWQSVGYGTTVSWPAVQGGIGAQGNPGMVNAIKGTPYSVGYIGISFKSATDQASLGEAALQNKDGNFVLPNEETVNAAVKEMVAKTPQDERLSLIFAPGAKSYPIINFEYAIINSSQSSKDDAATLRSFLTWSISPNGGNASKYLKQVGFVALPSEVVVLSKKQITKIQ